jgi:flagellar protein FlbD
VIRLTRLDGSKLIVNAELIEFVEGTPDTVVTMTTGRKVVVRESPDEVIRSVIEYRAQVGARSRTVAER